MMLWTLKVESCSSKIANQDAVDHQPREDFNLFARLTTEDVLTMGATWRPELTQGLQTELDSIFAKAKICSTAFSW